MRRLRVLFVLHTLDYAGVEKLVSDFIFRNRSIITPAVIVLDRVGPLGSKLREIGVPVYFTKRKAGLDLSQIKKFGQIYREFSPDVIHAHQYTPFFYSALAGLKCKCGKIIFTEHGRHFPDEVSQLRKLSNKFLVTQASAITAVCEFTKKSLVYNEGLPDKPIKVIYNGIDTKQNVAHLDKTLFSLEYDWPVVVQVGNFRHVKNQIIAIQAFRKVIDKRINAYLLFVGIGDTLPQCKESTNKLGLDEYIKFAGKQENVLGILSFCDIMLNTSLSEGCSIAILEAMFCNLPVLASRVGGNPELVLDGKTGLLFDVNDVNELADKLTKLILNSDLRKNLGKEGKKRVLEEFNIERMDKEYLTLYNEVA